MSRPRTRKATIDCPALGPKAAEAFELLLETPPWRSWKLSPLLTELAFRGARISPAAWYRRVLPRLERWGVEHAKGIGYRLPAEARPFAWAPPAGKHVGGQVGATTGPGE